MVEKTDNLAEPKGKSLELALDAGNGVPPLRRSIRGWLIGGLALALIAAAFIFFVPQPTVVNAAGPVPSPNCASCHKTTLNYHDRLGSGDKACWVCHDTVDMSKLRLLDSTVLARSESSQVCGQCHQRRYESWQQGTHGIPGTVAAASCTTCHNPHQPQMAFLGITKPHPPPNHTPPPPSTDLAIILGATFVIMVGTGIVLSRRKRLS